MPVCPLFPICGHVRSRRCAWHTSTGTLTGDTVAHMDAAFKTWPDGHECFLPSADHNETRGFVYACGCGRRYLYRGSMWDRNRNDQWVVLNWDPVQHGSMGVRPTMAMAASKTSLGRLAAAANRIWMRSLRRWL